VQLFLNTRRIFSFRRGCKILFFLSKPNKESTCNVEETNFVGKKHGVLYYASFLYPAGYANSMQILETLKLHAV
jgi:hypothetical protein